MLVIYPLPKESALSQTRTRVKKPDTTRDPRPRARSHAALLFGETSQIRELTRVMHQQKTTIARARACTDDDDDPPTPVLRSRVPLDQISELALA